MVDKGLVVVVVHDLGVVVGDLAAVPVDLSSQLTHSCQNVTALFVGLKNVSAGTHNFIGQFHICILAMIRVQFEGPHILAKMFATATPSKGGNTYEPFYSRGEFFFVFNN